jgi:selenide,water dikinase
MVQTVDFFTPIVDDPYAWGRIAAANALSDVYAMGARPVTALNLVGWPRSLDFELLGRVIEGASDACAEANTAIIGGHSIDDPEPKFGLAVTGLVHPDRLVRNTGAAPGSELVLTKPLGMGIISSGVKEGKTSAPTQHRAIEIMSQLNRSASEAMIQVGISAATDVTGFGLIGHLLEMLEDRLSAELRFESIPVLEEAFDLVEQGVLPGGSKRNYEAARDLVEAGGLDRASKLVLFDAQTSGGLLIAVDGAKTSALLSELDARGIRGHAIGRLIEGDGRVNVS